MACSKEDPKPVYTSIEGKWKFSAKDVSGEFYIVNYSGKLTVDNGPNDFFVVNGTRYSITSKHEVEGKLPGLLTFYLVNGDTYVILQKLDVNKTYDQFVTSNYEYGTGAKNTIVADKIILTR